MGNLDPITGAVVAIVLWFLAISIGWVVAYFLGVILDVAGGGGGVVGAIIGWLIGAGWAIFAVIQAILQIVHLIQLIIGG